MACHVVVVVVVVEDGGILGANAANTCEAIHLLWCHLLVFIFSAGVAVRFACVRLTSLPRELCSGLLFFAVFAYLSTWGVAHVA